VADARAHAARSTQKQTLANTLIAAGLGVGGGNSTHTHPEQRCPSKGNSQGQERGSSSDINAASKTRPN